MNTEGYDVISPRPRFISGFKELFLEIHEIHTLSPKDRL